MPTGLHPPVITDRNVSIVQSYLTGQSQKAIAKTYGISQAQVSRILSDDDCKAIIDTTHRDMIRLVPLAINNYCEFLASKNEAVRYKSSQDLLKIIGIMPTHSQT
ncbi:MAG TPA: hypothetical protein ENH82_11760, partial [bacterium]|nr:hypothetical protein [bacterium]